MSPPDALPSFPVDDVTLDLLWDALHPGPEAERTSLSDTLDMLSRLGGSDPEAIEEVLDDGGDGGAPVHMMRDPIYTEHSAIVALIEEVRKLRRERRNDSHILDAWKAHHAALHPTCDAYGPGLSHRVVRADADTPTHNFRCLGCGQKIGHLHLDGCER